MRPDPLAYLGLELDSLKQQLSMEGAIRISTDNLVRAGMPLVDAIAQNWDSWREGVPGN